MKLPRFWRILREILGRVPKNWALMRAFFAVNICSHASWHTCKNNWDLFTRCTWTNLASLKRWWTTVWWCSLRYPHVPTPTCQHFSQVDEVLLPDAVELCLPQAILGSVSWWTGERFRMSTWDMSHIESLLWCTLMYFVWDISWNYPGWVCNLWFSRLVFLSPQRSFSYS